MGQAPWGKAIRMGGLAQGRLGSDGPLVARKVLDKHDENHTPPEAAAALRTGQEAQNTRMLQKASP